MVTIKELKKHYEVFKHGKDTFLIHELKTGNSRMVHKYLCTVTRIQKRYWSVVGQGIPTAKLDVLKANIEKYVDSLEYDSEYYYPMYRKGVFEEHIIHDYLSSIGFKYGSSYSDIETYKLNQKNIYGKESVISLTFVGLNSFNKVSEYVEISYSIAFGSWVSVKVKRNVDDIKKGIDSILKPLFLSDAATGIINDDKLESNEQLEVLFNQLIGFTKSESSGREELKLKLLNLVNSL